MKALDVINQLRALVPKLVGSLTSQLVITSLTSSVGTATVVATAHGLSTGGVVVIAGVKTQIIISTMSRIGVIGTLITATDHDVTFGHPVDVILVGSTEAEFNGTFTIMSVPNRRTINFTMVDSGATSASGSPLLLNGFSVLSTYNGLKEVTVVDVDTFTYTIPAGLFSPPNIEEAFIRTSPRISGTISFERLLESYTEQSPDELWLFVSLGDVNSSKDRNILSDATSNSQRTDGYRQQILQPVSLFLVVPTSDEIAGREARDLAEDMFQVLCKSILFSKFDSGLFVGKQGPLQFISHGLRFYNTAFYIHEYIFEQVVDLTFDDTVGADDDVAFRDIELIMSLSIGTMEAFAKNIDLDDEPL